MRRPILVTGSHRSGTTWVGRMIAQSRDIYYIHEPFNVEHPPSVGISAARFDHWYTQIDKGNESKYRSPLESTLSFSYNWKGAAKRIRSRHHVRKVLSEYRSFLNAKRLCKRALIKDPLALFSAEWLFETFDTQNIILVRHPAAFASSLKRLNWRFNFSHLIAQETLFYQQDFPYRDEIVQYTEQPRDLIDQAALLWCILHSRILHYKEKFPNWLILRHEDISTNPLEEYGRIYQYLCLTFSESVQSVIADYSSSQNPIEGPKGTVHTLKRDSKANVKSWQTRLSEREIERIYNKVENLSSHFYTDLDWS